jgi:hypothetical protein
MNVLSILIGPVVEAYKSYQDGKQKKRELDNALQEKRLEVISKSEDYAQAFRLAQVQNAGWRPGFWTIVLSVPVIMCFVPGLAPVVEQGFQALDRSTPDWFQYLLGIAVTSAFGYSVADKAYEWWKAP